jgi:hypothetical protein
LKTPSDKRACHAQTGATFVDMETAALAQAASERRIPYLSIRVLLDTVDEMLPDFPALNSQGKLQPQGLVKALRQPKNILAMRKFARRIQHDSQELLRCLSAFLKEEGQLSSILLSKAHNRRQIES